MKNMGEGSLSQFAEKLILAVIARSISDATISKCLILLGMGLLRFARNDT